MIDKLRIAVILGAFFHDIGKALQRGQNDEEIIYAKHPFFSYDFLNNLDANSKKYFIDLLSEEGWDVLLNCVKIHHENDQYPDGCNVNKIFDNKQKILSTIVSRADNYSASERGKRSFDAKGNFRTKPLYSVFSRIELNSKNESEYKAYPFNILSPSEEVIFAQEKKANFLDDLKILISDFKKTFLGIGSIKKREEKILISILNTLFMKYFWCIPANTQEDYPDVSLYDHLKCTAAICACIYDYHVDRGSIDSLVDIQNDTNKSFRMMVVDFSGIQKYIYNIKKNKYAAKRLRARSFMVQLILEEIKEYVLKEFDLPVFNVLMQSGGKFFVLLPNIQSVDEKIEKMRDRFDNLTLDRFQGEVCLNIALSDAFSGVDFADFGLLLEKVLKKLNHNKLQKFVNTLSDRGFVVEQTFEGKKVCNYCRSFPVFDNDVEMCELCGQDMRVGEFIKNHHAVYVVFGDVGEYKLLDKKYSLISDIKYLENIDVEKIFVINPDLTQIDFGIFSHLFEVQFLANYVPGEIGLHDFESMADISEGNNMLGVLKADVDNLGQIFSLGLKRDENKDGGQSYDSLSRQATLSRFLDYFFSYYLNNLVRKEYSECYVAYAGGDDLLIIGPWNIVIGLAERIKDELEKFTGNNQITLSAGVNFCKPKYPIYKAILEADEVLDMAKGQKKKNSFALFGKVNNWIEWKIIRQEMELLSQWQKEKKYNVGLLRSMLNFGRQIDDYYLDTSKKQYLMWQPKLTYYLARNVKDIRVREWFGKVMGMDKQDDYEQVEKYELIKKNFVLMAHYLLYLNR